MNGTSINTFETNHPTTVQASLFALALFARFSPTGRYVCVGRMDGVAVVWDLETRAAVRWLDGHVKGLTAVDWSRNSRYVLTCAKDWNVIVWDLMAENERLWTLRFDAPVMSACFHPRNSQIILVLLNTGEAYMNDLRKSHRSRTDLWDPQNDENEDERTVITVARFDPSGKHVFAGTAAGELLVFNSRTKTLVARHKISGAMSMKGLDFAKSGRRLVTNSTDRTLRQFSLPVYPPPNEHRDYIEVELEPTHRFNDPINKTAWHAMSYSPNGEWLAGGAADPASHKIYIWDISNDGRFASALDGGREPLTYVHWHPYKSCIASTTVHGNVLIWHAPTPERWGAFAGGFEEVDENIVYQEREDEFDIEDEAEVMRRKELHESQEIDVERLEEWEKDPRLMQTNAWTPNNGEDEDLIWADDEPDEDGSVLAMRIIIEDDS